MVRRIAGASGLYLFAWALVTLIVATPSTAGAFRNVEVGKSCPDFRLKDMAGAQVALSDQQGKAVVVCFWTVERPNSVAILEILQQLYPQYKDKGLVVLAVNTDSAASDKVAELIAQKGITFPVLLDAGREAYGAFGVFIQPTIGLCGKDGVLIEELSYSSHMKPILEGKIKILLGLATAEAVDKSLATSSEPGKTTDEKNVDRHVSLAEALIGQKMYDKALDELNKAAAIRADDPALQIAMGRTFMLLEKPAEAKTAFEKALAANPASRDAKEGLGEALEATGEYDKALEILKGALQLNPRPAPIYYRIGRISEAKGDLPGAVENYKKALKLLLED